MKEPIYLELNFKIYPLEPFRDLLIHELSNHGFDAFVETDFGMTTYALKEGFDEQELHHLLEDLERTECQISYAKEEMKVENWNQNIEKDLPPVIIRQQCLICKPDFQTDKIYPYRILIEPNLSFGTGHHPTTHLMIEQLLQYTLTDKVLFDVGCGTGILSILAAQMGAKTVHAIELEPRVYDNAQHNFSLNDLQNMHLYLGTLPTLSLNKKADLILANLSRNVLLEEMPVYYELLNPKSHLLISGFMDLDLDLLNTAAQKLGFKKLNHDKMEGWGFLSFYKF